MSTTSDPLAHERARCAEQQKLWDRQAQLDAERTRNEFRADLKGRQDAEKAAYAARQRILNESGSRMQTERQADFSFSDRVVDLEPNPFGDRQRASVFARVRERVATSFRVLRAMRMRACEAKVARVRAKADTIERSMARERADEKARNEARQRTEREKPKACEKQRQPEMFQTRTKTRSRGRAQMVR